MIDKSIRYKLSLYISFAIISVFIAFIIVIYFYNLKLLKENIESRAISLSTEINMVVNKNIVTTREVATNVAEQIVYYSMHNSAEVLVTSVMKKYDFIETIHINIDSTININEHNYYITRNADTLRFKRGNLRTFDCMDEEKIINQMTKTKRKGWSAPYKCDTNGDVVVSYYCPITEISDNFDTTIIGEVICELSIYQLNENINNIKMEKGGFAFLIEPNGNFITHPVKERILNDNILELSPKVINPNKIDLENILKSKASGSVIAYPELLDFKKAWVYYTPVNNCRWYLLFVLPYHKLFSDLYMITLWLLIFAVAGIITIILIIALITRKLIEPLSDVTSQLNKFSKEAGQHSVNTLNEIKLVSESLKSIKKWYLKYKDEQNRELINSNLQKQDLMQASEIQKSLIKTEFPAFPDRKEIDLYAIYQPAREVSGDLFDYFFIDEDNLVFTIGDVSGKGVPAAIFMSVAQTIIKSFAGYKRARNIVNKANKELCTNNQHQFFLTLFLGALNVKKGELRYCNAAHTTGIILKHDGEIVELNQPHGLPLGLYPDKNYSDSKVVIEKGDSIVLYTDGVTELQNDDKKQFGFTRFKETLKPFYNLEPDEMAKKIENVLEQYKGTAEQYDDLSIFIVKYNG